MGDSRSTGAIILAQAGPLFGESRHKKGLVRNRFVNDVNNGKKAPLAASFDQAMDGRNRKDS